MTTSPADSASPDAAPQSPTREVAECEAGLRRVLAYICARRRRRLIAGTIVFMVLFQSIDGLTSIPRALLIPFIAVLGGNNLVETIFGNPIIFGLWILAAKLLLSLIITLVIFSRLRRIYRGY